MHIYMHIYSYIYMHTYMHILPLHYYCTTPPVGSFKWWEKWSNIWKNILFNRGTKINEKTSMTKNMEHKDQVKQATKMHVYIYKHTNMHIRQYVYALFVCNSFIYFHFILFLYFMCLCIVLLIYMVYSLFKLFVLFCFYVI